MTQPVAETHDRIEPVYFITYLSPNGSTRVVAEIFADQLRLSGQDVRMVDLADRSARSKIGKELESARKACLLIGSPVYRDKAVEPVMTFIEDLPEVENAWSVPFVTWGLACSGVALWQMGEALLKKGWPLAGAAKVAALHSMMFQSDAPVGKGRPDETDRQQVRILVDKVVQRISSGKAKPLPLEDLDYQPEPLATQIKAKMSDPKLIIPKAVDTDSCTLCAICEENCPVEAVTLDPSPQFNDRCIDCFQCIRLCPEEAITPGKPLKKIEAMILGRVNSLKERPLTEIFSGQK